MCCLFLSSGRQCDSGQGPVPEDATHRPLTPTSKAVGNNRRTRRKQGTCASTARRPEGRPKPNLRSAQALGSLAQQAKPNAARDGRCYAPQHQGGGTSGAKPARAQHARPSEGPCLACGLRGLQVDGSLWGGRLPTYVGGGCSHLNRNLYLTSMTCSLL